MTYLTDERLKSYLDSNQLHREQLALAILAIDKRYADVRPRHPRGGRDGGRDIEAVYRGDQRTFGAVGFVNQADDSEEKKKTIRSKFNSDLKSALQASLPPSAFVFFTNINLTVGDKDSLIESAKKLGVTHCEILDRERLRISLDSADGFAIRFQYLGIPLSEPEQASFFAKWGDDINSLVSTGFQKVQNTLDHLLFLQESNDPLKGLTVVFQLDKAYPAEEIHHFRAFCSVYLKEPKLKTFSILFGASDKSNRFSNEENTNLNNFRAGIQFGFSSAQWEQHIEDLSNEESLDKKSQ